MEPETIKTNTLIASLILIISTEALAWWSNGFHFLPPLALLGMARLIQITGIILLVVKWDLGLGTIQWAPNTWMNGFKLGVLWSMGFGAVAAMGIIFVHLSGHNPFLMLRTPLPKSASGLALFFFVGGVIAPVAEEICFRGILYGFFRHWCVRFYSHSGLSYARPIGILSALAVSTAIFTILHAVQGLPVTQIVGGVIFAIAYETTRNLTTPITIHMLGNLALFTISLLPKGYIS